MWCNSRMADDTQLTSTWDALDVLARALDGVEFRLPTAERADLEELRRSVVDDIRHHIGPRLSAHDAPLIVAVAGPSGAGVSATVNMLAGDEVSEVGPLRPTTTQPVVWCRPDDRGPWWETLVGLLGGSDDVAVATGGGVGAVPVVLIDVPGSSTDALRIASMADLCIFVASPARYADAATVELGVGLKERGLPLLFLMNRLPEDPWQRNDLIDAYGVTLQRHGVADDLDPKTVFAASELEPGTSALAGPDRLRLELAALADETFGRQLVVGALANRVQAVADGARRLAAAFEDERALSQTYRVIAREAYRRQAAQLVDELGDGTLSGLTRHPTFGEAAVDLAGIVTRRAGVAAVDAVDAWEHDDLGKQLVDEAGAGLRRHGPETAFDTQGALERWFDELGERAASDSRRGRGGRRRRRRLARGLWATILDPQRPLSRLTSRAFASPGHVVEEGRRTLGEVIERSLDADAGRFLTHLGDPIDGVRLGRVVSASAAAASGAAVAESLGDFGRPRAAGRGVPDDA